MCGDFKRDINISTVLTITTTEFIINKNKGWSPTSWLLTYATKGDRNEIYLS